MKMKNMKFTALILVLALCAGLVFSGCGNRQKEEAEEVVAEIVVFDDAESASLVIGDTSASVEILMTNEMGGTITGLAVKSPDVSRYSDNMMTTGQQFENEQTAEFYLEPDDVAFTGTALTPGQSDVGYWNVAGDTQAELDVISVSGNSVTFRLWWNRLAQTDEITAQLDAQNIGSFTGQVNDITLDGRIAFYDGFVVVAIDQSALDRIPEGATVFDERHETCWREEGAPDSSDYDEDEDDYDEEEEEEEEDTALSAALASTEDDTFSLQVTMGGSVYELYGFDVEDMEEVTLYLEGGVPYLEYISLATNTLVSTKSLQKQITEDKQAAQTVIDMIAALQTVTEDNAEEMEEEIEAARAAYDALTDSQKAYVTNLSLLVEKESLLADALSYYDEEDDYDYDDYDDYDYEEEDEDTGEDYYDEEEWDDDYDEDEEEYNNADDEVDEEWNENEDEDTP